MDDRAAALVALVESHRAAKCRDLVAPAADEARRAIGGARRIARTRVATTIAAERSAFAARVASAEAQLATRRRMARQHRLKALLVEGWQRLPRALAARWADAGSRRLWVEACLARAQSTLPPGPWTIQVPAAWSGAERAAAAAWLEERRIEASFEPRADIDAGLRVVSGGIVIDATLAGLIEDRLAIEGRLLHHFEEATP